MRWIRTPSPGLLAALVTLAAVPLTLYRLGDASLWLDEAVSMSIAARPLDRFWEIVTTVQLNHSLYYLLLRPWMALGDSEAAVRSLSVIWAVATIPVVYFLGKRLIGPYAGAAAAALVAAHPFLLGFAQQARGYSLLVFTASVGTLLLVEAVRRDRRALWIGWGLVAGVSMYIHFFAALTLVAQIAALMLVRGTSRLNLALGLGAAATIGLPAGAFIARNLRATQIAWIPAPTLQSLTDALLALAGGGSLILTMLILGLGMTGVAAAVVGRRIFPGALLVSWFAVPIAVSVAVSVFAKPIFMPYYVIPSIVPLALLAAWGIAAIRPRMLGGLAAAAVLVFSLSLAGRPSGVVREDWRGTTAALVEASEQGDRVVILADYARIPVEYYVERLGAPAAEPLYPPQPWGTFVYGDRGTGTLPAAAGDLRIGDRVWAVLRSSPLELTEVLSAVGGREVSSREFEGRIRLVEIEVVREPGEG